jgi:polyisoprenoid-binding protein YceI
MTFRFTGVRPDGENFLLDGELTIRGVTRPITLTVELGGIGPDPYGGIRAGFSATTVINGNDFDVMNRPGESGDSGAHQPATPPLRAAA